MDAGERELFGKSLRQAAGQHSGAALDAALEDLGWHDALALDPRAAVSLLFEAQGTTNATSSALDRVVLAALVLDPGADTTPPPGLVLPPLGHFDPPGQALGQTLAGTGPSSGRRGGGEIVAVAGIGTGALVRHQAAVVATGQGDQVVAAVVPTAELGLRAVEGLDPELGLVEVGGDGVEAESLVVLAPGMWEEAVAAGQRALAHELVGVGRAMLQLARDHAVDRIQFGRPIATFQAVRHRLADTLVAIEAADAAAGAAWDDGTPLTAALAKAIAGRAARTAARHCQQVLAGIGVTTEHPLHRYVRRALVLDRLLGDARSLTHQMGEELLRTRRLPGLLPL